MLCASSLAMALLLLAGCEDERYGKLKGRTRGAINNRGRGANGSQVPRANPGCHLELTESALFFLLAAFHFWCEISPKYEKKSKYSVFSAYNCQISPTQKFEFFLPHLESDFNLVIFL